MKGYILNIVVRRDYMVFGIMEKKRGCSAASASKRSKERTKPDSKNKPKHRNGIVGKVLHDEMRKQEDTLLRLSKR